METGGFFLVGKQLRHKPDHYPLSGATVNYRHSCNSIPLEHVHDMYRGKLHLCLLLADDVPLHSFTAAQEVQYLRYRLHSD